MTAYIVQVSLGDTPQGTLEYRTIFAVGMLLFLDDVRPEPGQHLAARALPRGIRVMDGQRSRPACVDAGGDRRRHVPVALGVLVLALRWRSAALVWRRRRATARSRLSWQFLTSFPSRRAAEAGIYHALVGSIFVIVADTAALALPIGVAAAIYLEEYGGRSRMARLIELNIANLAGGAVDHLRPARPRPVRAR